MQWTDIASVVGKAAPLLGGLLAGPAGAAVGGLVASALGTAATPDAVSQALATNPDAAVKLADIEARRAVELQALLIQSEQNRLSAETAAMQAEVDNSKSAREMQATTRSYVPAILAIVITVGFLGLLVGLLAGWLHVADSQALMLLLGSLTTAWSGACSFYFGSSLGSHNKDRIAAVAKG